MSYTQDFLKYDFQFNYMTPTENLARFEPVAIRALSDLQTKIDAQAFKAEDVITRRDISITQTASEMVTNNPAGLKGVVRVEAGNKDRHQQVIQDAIANGQQLLTMVSIEGSTMIVFYFMEKGVTRESLIEQARERATARVDSEIEREKVYLKTYTDDMKSLKKAVQARKAEIKPFEKILADY